MIMKYKEELLALMGTLNFHHLDEVIQLIHEGGGGVVLPGGYLRNKATFVDDMDEVLSLGIDGVEGFSPNFSDER